MFWEAASAFAKGLLLQPGTVICCTEQPVETEGKDPQPIEVLKPVQPEPVENGSKEPEPEAVVVGAKEQVESVNSEVKEEAPSPCSPPPPGKSNSLSLKPFTVKVHAVFYN